MFISKKEINYIKKHIEIQDQINKNILITMEQHNERIKILEKIIQNQPLIKKYQKTLDIFLKNAQD